MKEVKRGRPLGRDAKGNAARERLLQAGYAFIAKRPFDSVTVDEIADAAGVAHGLLFHYFGSKQGLYLEIMRDAAEQLEKVHLEQHPPGVPAEEKLAAFLRRRSGLSVRSATATRIGTGLSTVATATNTPQGTDPGRRDVGQN